MILAEYASSDAKSKGRMYPDYTNIIRSDFQRDRDRIIHSSAFRKLEGKTQVFAYHEGRNYRTRLTHSIEVAQITRTLCKNLSLNEELGEAIALAHDIGHAPFGHAGERGLKNCMKEYGGFDHNVNSLKIMTEVETHYPKFKGLNLTWETLEGTVKHNGPLKNTNEWLKAFNKKFPLDLKKYPSIEAQIASFADDIAYNNHDIDDGFRAGFFNIKDLCELDFIKEILAKFDFENPNMDDNIRIYAITRSLISAMIFDLIKTTNENIVKNKIKTDQDIRNAKSFTANFSKEMHQHIYDLHNFLIKHFMNDYKLLPISLRNETSNSSSDKEKASLICQYIADMTDATAVEEHQKLFNITYRF